MMLCYSKTRKIKFFLATPLPRLKDTNSCDICTRTSVCLYQQPATWKSVLSRLSDSEYKVIPSLKIIF